MSEANRGRGHREPTDLEYCNGHLREGLQQSANLRLLAVARRSRVPILPIACSFAAQTIPPPRGELRPPADKQFHAVQIRLLSTGGGPTTPAGLKLPTWLTADSSGKSLKGDGLLIHLFFDRPTKESEQKVAEWESFKRAHPHQNGFITYKAWMGHADISRQLGRTILMTVMESSKGTLTYSASWETRDSQGRAHAVGALVCILQSLPPRA